MFTILPNVPRPRVVLLAVGFCLLISLNASVAWTSGPPADPPPAVPPDEDVGEPPLPPGDSPPVVGEFAAPGSLQDLNIQSSATFSGVLTDNLVLNDYLHRVREADRRDDRQARTSAASRADPASSADRSITDMGGMFGISGDSVFGRMQYSRGGRDTRDDQTGYRYDASGLFLGIDSRERDNLRVGGMAGARRMNAEFRGDRGETEIDSFRLGTYAAWEFVENAYIHGGVSGGAHRYRTERGDEPVESKHWGHDISGFAASGYGFALTESWTLTPEGSVQYIYLRERAYRDSDDTKVSRRTEDVLRAGTDLRLSYWSPGVAVLAYTGELLGGVAYDVSADHGEIWGRTANGDPFRARGPSPRRVTGVFGGSLGLVFDEDWSMDTRYRGRVGSDAYDHTVSVEFRRRF